MKTKNIKDYVAFGRDINYLRLVEPGFYYHKENFVKDSFERFIENIDELNLEVTSKINWFKELKKYKERLDKTNNDYKLREEDVNEIFPLMDKLNRVINAELEGRIVYVITEKRIKVEKLLDEIKDLFALNIFIELPDLPRFDFKEGGKCIAFERATAGAFHILRGLEGIVRWFFDKFTSSSGCTDNWGNILINLRNISVPPPSEILDQLDAIRVNYRNPTAHPELIYTIDDVQDLLSECIAVVNRIVNHLKDKNLI
ncbi:MAG: hypothetical protein KGD67_09335 [Candidatus Lokiarchaeota archaeon]|nr:hypothetical protein [Candidatus Lokiarchaeota archaeon]